MEIRWDTERMRELSRLLDRKAGDSLRLRRDVIDAMAGCRRPTVDLRALAIAAEWCSHHTGRLDARRQLLLAAESQLMWDLDRGEDEGPGWQPRLRSRSLEAITSDIDATLARIASESAHRGSITVARAELDLAELTLELAVAIRDRELLGAHSADPQALAAINEVIDFLGYQLAKFRPMRPPDLGRAATALDLVRSHLDESWFDDVGRGDLQAIGEALGDLERPELDAVIGELSDDELYRWFHELDGIRGGNLSAPEESDLFATLAKSAGAVTLFRLARAERGSRFAEIAAAVRSGAAPETAMEFIELCALHAADSDDALIAALAGMAALGAAEQSAVARSLDQQGLLDSLADAAGSFLERMKLTRDDPVLIEFVEGIGAALGGSLVSMAELSFIGLVDRHRFRVAWSELGGVVAMAFTDPIDFVKVLLNVELLRRNPARWAGEASADVVALGLARAARLGRLGRSAARLAGWLRRLADTVIVEAGRLRVKAGHVRSVIEKLTAAADAAAMQRALTDWEATARGSS